MLWYFGINVVTFVTGWVLTLLFPNNVKIVLSKPFTHGVGLLFAMLNIIPLMSLFLLVAIFDNRIKFDRN